MRKIVLAICKMCALLSVFLWFIDPQIQIKARNKCTIHLVDVSNSILTPHTDTIRAINYLVQNSDDSDMHGLFVFANDVKEIVPIKNKFVVTQIKPEIDQDRSDLLSAVQLLIPIYPDGYSRHMVIYSDGNVENPQLVSSIAKQNGISITSFPIGILNPLDAKIISVDCPRFIEKETKLIATVNILSNASKKITVSMVSPTKSESKELVTIENATSRINFEIEAPATDYGIYTAKILEKDDCTQNNIYEYSIFKKSNAAEIAIISGFDQSPTYSILKEKYKIKVFKSATPEMLLTSGVIIIENALIPKELDMPIASFVKSGGGLVILGGDQSYGMGNFYNTEIEKISPLNAFPDEKDSIVFVLDKSGSMNLSIHEASSTKKIDFAVNSILRSIDLLHESDMAGVIAFDDNPKVSSQLVTKQKLNIGQISAGGGTRIIPALEAALDMLKNTETSRKHIVLITDGESNENPDLFKSVGELIKDVNTKLTTISTQKEKLERLQLLNGEIHVTTEFSKVDQIIKDIVAATKKLYSDNARLHARAPMHNILTGIKLVEKIQRINRTSSKKNKHTIVDSDSGPVIAVWDIEHGKVAACTFSIQKDWSGGLISWDGLGTLISNVVQYVKGKDKSIFNIIPAENSLVITSESLPDTSTEINCSINNVKTGESISARFSRDSLYSLTFRQRMKPGIYYASSTDCKGTFSVPYSYEYKNIGIKLDSLSEFGKIILTVDDLKKGFTREFTVESARTLILLSILFFFLSDICINSLWK